METKPHEVTTGCWINRQWQEVGAIVELTDEQAQELAPPYGSHVKLVETKKSSAKGKAYGEFSGDRRKNRESTD